MRPVPPEAGEATIIDILSPPPLHSRPSSSCDPPFHSCKWWPYSGSNDFGANTAMILIVLLCALICALAFNTAIRWFFRSNSSSDSDNHREVDDGEQRKPNSGPDMASLVVATTLAYTAGMKLGGGEVADCAICLSEFMEGEEIRVLGRCNHGFHLSCIEKWLSCRSSCPTCRRCCIASSPPSPEPGNCCQGNVNLDNNSQSAVPETERAPDNLINHENV